MELYFEVLSPEAQKVFKSFKSFFCDDFYLAGGTGLALQVGHRISADFDFFSSGVNLDFGSRQKIQNSFAATPFSFQIHKEESGTLILSVEGVRVSFFFYRYPLLEPVLSVEGIDLASIWDIGAMKLAAIVSRGSRRDFVDLYEISRRIPLEAVLDKAARKYEQVVDFSFQALKGLVYFEEAENEPMPRLLKPVSWGEIRGFFEREADKLAKNI